MSAATEVPNLTPDEALRLRCLELAGEVETARRFYAFVRSQESPRQIIEAALEAAGVR